MKYLILFIILGVACSDEKVDPTVENDMSADLVADMRNDSPDVAKDLADSSSFPDPNREGSKFCENSLDCKRFEYCTSLGACSFGRGGCGSLGKPPQVGGRDDVGCIIDEFGIGEFTGAECESDDVCPSDMPNCYLRACQTQPRCKVDTDCDDGTQICDNEIWCATMPPCEVDDDCGRGGCGEDNVCDYNL